MCQRESKTKTNTNLFKKSQGPDPFLQTLEFKRCMNEMLKCWCFLGFFRRVLVFQDFLVILGVGTLITQTKSHGKRRHLLI